MKTRSTGLLIALAALAALLTLVIVGTTVTLAEALQQGLGGLDIRIDGERAISVPPGEVAGWVTVVAALAGLALLVVVPLALLMALLLATLALAGALVLVLAVAALALSPLWMTALLLWWATRRRRETLDGREGREGNERRGDEPAARPHGA